MMSNLNNGCSFTDQEVRLLFAEYLPLQPMPSELATRLKGHVMAEVACTLRKTKRRPLLPALPISWPWTGVRGSRRR
jgi:hypothetical protein